MKVVLFCGGMGTRLRTSEHSLPKPMARIGYRPILWHLMKYYAHFGHTEFILALGFKADVIKDYFLRYDEALSNDFVLSRGGADVELLGSDIDEWKITFVDTGISASVGERLQALRPHLEGEEYFLANYADGLTDLNLNQYIDVARERDAIASFLSVKPNVSFHFVDAAPDGMVHSIHPAASSNTWINGGFFVLHRSIFDYMLPGEDLVTAPFQRLIDDRRLYAHRYDHGFWVAMDTFKDHQQLQDLHSRGPAPWQVWVESATPTPAVSPFHALVDPARL